MHQPLVLRLLARFLRGPQLEYVLGDIAEEYGRIRRSGRSGARWWLLRQGVGAVFYRSRDAFGGGSGGDADRNAPSPSGRVGLFLETWIQDLRFGTRLLLRDRLVTFTVVATLSLGIGATATMYSITRGILRDLPFDNPEQLVTIDITDTERNITDQDAPLIDLEEWRAVQTTMVDIAGVSRQAFHVAPANGTPVRVQGAAVSPWSFRLLGASPLLGRDFRSASEDAHSVILGYHVWTNVFDRARDVVGRTMRVDGEQRTIIGVMPDGFGFPRAEQLWIPLVSSRDRGMTGMDETSDAASFQRATVFGRITPEHSLQDAKNEFATLGRATDMLRPDDTGAEIVEVSPFAYRFVGDDAPALMYTMLAIVSSILLIACANVTNLLLARAVARGREMALRSALGSSRARLFRQLLTETLIMTLFGTAGGILCAGLAVRWFNLTVGHRIEIFWISFTVDVGVLAFIIGLTAMTTLAVGAVPALRGSRADLNRALQDGRGAISPIRMGNVTRFLVVAEVAVSVVLLVASGVMVRGVLGLSFRDVRFDTANVATARVRLAAFDYPDNSSLVSLYERLERGWLDGSAGDVVMMSALPGQTTVQSMFALDGIPYARHSELPTAQIRTVSDTFFEVFDVYATSGRVFDERDTMDNTPITVVNTAFADQHFEGSAVGRRVRIGDLTSRNPWREIVGVIDDRGATLQDGRGAAGLFVPISQSPLRVVTLAARYDGITTEAAVSALRDGVSAVDANLPLYEIATLDAALKDEIAPQRTFAILFGVFGGLALCLAAVGLYGTMSFTVLQRLREFGVRRALGARPAHLITNVVRSVALQLALGLAIGLVLAAIVSPFLRDFTFGADPRDPLVFSLVLLALSTTAVVASLVPTRRAARVDPMQVLREE